MPNYETFKKHIYENHAKFLEFVNLSKTKLLTPTEIKEQAVIGYKVNQPIEKLVNKYKNSMSWMDIMNHIKKNHPENLNNFYITLGIELKRAGVKDFKNMENNVLPEDFAKKNDEEKITYAIEKINGINLPKVKQDIVDKIFDNYVIAKVKDPDKEKLDSFFLKLENSGLEIKEEDLLEPNDCVHPIIAGDDADEGLVDKEIDEILENVEDEDDPIYSLIEAKRIVRRGKSDYGAESPAEYMGKASNKILNINVIEYLKKKPYGENFSRSELGEAINISKDMPIETKSQFVKEIFNEKVNITDDVKKQVKEICDDFHKTKFNYEKAFNEIDPDYGKNPQGLDAWVVPTIARLEKSIKEKKYDKTVELLKDYKTYEAETDAIMAKINKLHDDDYMPGNISLSRNRAVPAKYRNDVIGASRFNSVANSIFNTKIPGFKIEDFLNDPLEAYKNLQIKNIKNAYDKVNEFMTTTPLNTILHKHICQDGATDELYYDSLGAYNQTLKITEAIPTLFGGDTGKDFFVKSSVLNTALSLQVGQIEHISRNHIKESDKMLIDTKRLILVEPEDRNIFKICADAQDYLDLTTNEPNNPFNEQEYYNTKTNASSLALRAGDAFKYFLEGSYDHGGDITKAASNLVNFINENEMTPAVKIVVNCIKKNNMSAFNAKLRNELSSEGAILNISKKGVTSENITKAFTSLANVEKIYNARSNNLKKNDPNVAVEKRAIDNMYQKLVEATGKTLPELQKIVANGRSSGNSLIQFANEVGNLKNELQAKENAPKPLTIEEQKEKLLRETIALRDDLNKKYRDAIKEDPNLDLKHSNDPNFKFFNKTDEEIKAIIDQKFDFYKFCREHELKRLEREAINKKTGNKFDYVRGADQLSMDPEMYKKHLNEINTEAKGEHFRAKIFKNLAECDFHELAEAYKDNNKFKEFVTNNDLLIETAMSSSFIGVDASKYYSDTTKKTLQQRDLVEGPFAAFRNKLAFNASPFSMLFDDNDLKNKEKTASVVEYGEITKTTLGGFGKTREELILKDSIANTELMAINDVEMDSLENALYCNGVKVTNASIYKSSDPNKKLIDAFKDGTAILKTDEEIEQMEKDFSLFDISALKDRLSDKKERNSVSVEDKNKYNAFIKSKAKDPFVERKAEYKDTNLRTLLRSRLKTNSSLTRHRMDKPVLELIEMEKRYSQRTPGQKFREFIFPNIFTETGRLANQIKERKKFLLKTFKLTDHELQIYRDIRDEKERAEQAANNQNENQQNILPEQQNNEENNNVVVQHRHRIDDLEHYLQNQNNNNVVEQPQNINDNNVINNNKVVVNFEENKNSGAQYLNEGDRQLGNQQVNENNKSNNT